ncbi:MAG: aromatic acid/H+ symport family MFS transporter [Firmicutes bacterium]|nr:aromatic acid/H+ symport family MFS transporter [Bacillota bacterium]
MNKVMISEVIDNLGISKFTFKIYFLIGLVLLFDGFDYMIVAYTMPQISGEWGLTLVQTGSLASWSLLGLMIGGLFAGIISDRIGRKNILIFSCLAYSILTFSIYFALNYETFAILRILVGFGLGACIPVSVTLVSEFAPTKNRGFFTSSIMAFYIMGWVVAGIVATYVVPVFGWRICYLVGALPALYVLILAFFLNESPHWLLSKGREKEAINVISIMEKTVKGEASDWKEGDLVAPPPPKSFGIKAIFSSEYRLATINLCVMYFMGSLVIYGITGWLPSLLVEKGYGLIKSYSFAILQNLFSIVGSLVTGYIADIIGRRKNVILGWTFTAIAVVLLGYATNQWQVVFCGVLVGITMNYGLSGMQPLLTEAYRTEFRNTGVACTQAFGRIGGFCGPVAAGFVQQMGLDFTGTLIFFAVPSLICSIVALLFVRETIGERIESVVNVKV